MFLNYYFNFAFVNGAENVLYNNDLLIIENINLLYNASSLFSLISKF